MWGDYLLLEGLIRIERVWGAGAAPTTPLKKTGYKPPHSTSSREPISESDIVPISAKCPRPWKKV